MKILSNCKGFIFPPILIAIIVLIVAGATAYVVEKNKDKESKLSAEKVETTSIRRETITLVKGRSSLDSGEKNPYLGVPCVSKPLALFQHDVTDYAEIKAVEPTITTVGNSRHRAWLDIDTAQAEKVPVYAPVDSELVEGVYKAARGALDYDLHFQVSCRIWYLINHVTEPVDKIKALFPKTPQSDTSINEPFAQSVSVKAGELIGYTSGTPLAHNFDFGVFDLTHFNESLPADNFSQYGKEKNFICPFDVLPEAIAKAYYIKIISSEKPYTNCVKY